MAAIRLVKPVDDNEELERRIMVSKPKLEKWQLLKAIGIPSLGEKVAKSLMTRYETFENLNKQSVPAITDIDGIGHKTAVAILGGLSALYDELTDVEQFFTFGSTVVVASQVLKGKTFVLSGTLEGGKAKWEKMITENGGTIGSGVTKTTTYLVAGPGSGSKTEKAQKYGVAVITEKDILGML
jgi:DNA ligase (NAD+)